MHVVLLKNWTRIEGTLGGPKINSVSEKSMTTHVFDEMNGYRIYICQI